MNKLPKTIYVRLLENGEVSVTDKAEDHAYTSEARTVSVYQLKGTVEVSTQIKQEIVVKKSPKKVMKAAVDPVPAELPDREKLLQEMRVIS